MRLIIYTGKGGTGKTVTSCSTGIKLADSGKKTLVISFDPAHTLSDAFKLNDQINASNNDEIEVLSNLNILQIDPIKQMNEQYSNVVTHIASIFSAKGLDDSLSYEIAMMPGMTQLFSLLKIEDVIRTRKYEVIVADMPASGEALRYLYLPKIAGNILGKFSGLTGIFSGFSKLFQSFSGISMADNILDQEQELIIKLDRLSKIIRDCNTTTMRLVANPDTFSIENAKRAIMSASLYGINVDLAVINKIMPKGHTNSPAAPDSYYSQWTEFQNRKVEEARASFYPLPIKELPLHPIELAGIELLRDNADLLFKASEDPAEIYFNEKPFSIIQNDSNHLQLVIRVPFTNQEAFDIQRSTKGEVVIKVRGSIGYIVNIIPLPAITYNMNIVRAFLNSNKLIIDFAKLQ
ncbi:MAG TPA: TRC40/GET3/ArsA family transport-energizing ATPase [Nitrososphaeraceae archaeon]